MCHGATSVWNRNYVEGMSVKIEISSRVNNSAQHLSPYPSFVLSNYFEYIDFRNLYRLDSGKNRRTL